MSDDHPISFTQPWPSRDNLKICKVRVIVTAPEAIPLIVVKIETSDAGLYGVGCATFTQRWHAVVAYIENHLERLLVGRHPADIGDLTRLTRLTAYWRDGGVQGNAISGVDMALWDIAGKRAGMPVHELVGGKVRAAADTYTHAAGATIDDTVSLAESYIAQGWRHVRLQVGQAGRGNYGAPGLSRPVAHAPYPEGWSVDEYLATTPRLFERAREVLGEQVALLHDSHSRLTPQQAVVLARSLEHYRLFFLEDVLPPEYWDRLPEVRRSSPVPLAVGELATSATTAAALITGGGVDLIRCHISAIGGFSPALKLAALAEHCGVRTAWHSPGDITPIGAAANVALDVTSPAFGIQECHRYNEATHDVFPGTIDITHGWMYPNETPGWGIDLDEKLAARFPPELSRHDDWAAGNRGIDGGLLFP